MDMTSRLLVITMAAALLAFSAVPSFADHHRGGRGGGWHGGGGNWNGGGGHHGGHVAAGELDPR
jgi:hypothetical protein